MSGRCVTQTKVGVCEPNERVDRSVEFEVEVEAKIIKRSDLFDAK